MNKSQMIMQIHRASPQLVRTVSRVGLHLKKNRPHILFGAGVVGTVATTVMACRATLKLNDTLDAAEKDIDYARAHDRDIPYAYIKAAGRITRLYGPSVAVGVVSIGCLSGAHVDLTRRNQALMAAYSALQASYDAYRDRVRDQLGDGELDIHRGLVAVKDEEGEMKLRVDPNARSMYARVFDSRNINWDRDPEINRLFLQIQQNYFNDQLIAYGHVFLNDVYRQLGFEHSPQGALVGWLADGDGDGRIDFGIYHNHNISNEWGEGIFLDFNVDGLIFEKI